MSDTYPPAGWVVVESIYRLWVSVPDEDRVTPQLIKDRNWEGSPYAAREIQLLEQPECEIAIQKPSYNRKWSPCGQPVAEGSSRCKWHGGPAKKPAPKPNLRSEVERLRRRVAELEVGS